MARFAHIVTMLGSIGIAAAVLLFIHAGWTAAADTPAPAPAAASGASAKPPLAGGVSNDALGDVLTNFGYEPQINTLPSGIKQYTITIDNADFKYVITMSLSENLKFVWLYCNLRTLTPQQRANSAQIVKLLQQNSNIGPAFFACASDYTITLNLPVANEQITPKKIREALDSFMADTKDNQALWDPGKWPTTAPSAP
jgi:hypothetical protein